MIIRNNEKGRSMIEMLGVLAIIGVLSAAGLAGYSKAMEKHKTNKLKEEIQLIVTNLITAFKNVEDYSALGTDKEVGTEVAVKLNAIPPEMIQSDGTVLHPFKGNVYVRAVDLNGNSAAAFTVDVEGLPRSIAISLATDATNDENSSLQYIKVNNN